MSYEVIARCKLGSYAAIVQAADATEALRIAKPIIRKFMPAGYAASWTVSLY